METSIEALPLEPLFVDRHAELATFDELLRLLDLGVRRHTALYGLRRIGKSLLLDEVRRRHPSVAIARLDVDSVVTTPEDFARAFVAESLRAVLRLRPGSRYIGDSDDSLLVAAGAVHPDLERMVSELLAAAQAEAHGRLLNQALRFPAEISARTGRPLLVMLDEFQDITRLRAFGETTTLLGAFRAALDRPSRVTFVVAGSRVTAMRRIIEDGGSPLFTRFTALELPPFSPDATLELAGHVWGDESRFEPDAVVRLQRLTGGWPFYVHSVAIRTDALVRNGPERITPDLVDIAFQQELIGRSGNIALHCQYLLQTALESVGDARRNRLEALLRYVARQGAVPRARLARHLSRHYSQNDIYSAINHLIDADFILEAEGVLRLADPVFAVWLNVEQDRRDPLGSIGNPQALRRLLFWYETQHAEDRATMGHLFEQQVENTVRRFRGQTVPGKLFGLDGDLTLPVTNSVDRLRVDDAKGEYGDGPDSYELDLVLVAASPEERWAVECKHRRGAITRPMIERFMRSTQGVERAQGTRFAHLWIVAPRGIRPDANELASRHGILRSGRRQLEVLDRLLQEPR
ncbi:MAG: AAA family ATPase [Chloroflexota bacterium]